jgi:hypothetical protein
MLYNIIEEEHQKKPNKQERGIKNGKANITLQQPLPIGEHFLDTRSAQKNNDEAMQH